MKRPHWWYIKKKPLVETDTWFCYVCSDVIEIEVNDILSSGEQDIYKFYGFGDLPSWSSRCWECKTKHLGCDFDCPNCGFSCDNEDYVITYGEPVSNVSRGIEFGGNPIDWETFVKCPICDTKFSYWDSNC